MRKLKWSMCFVYRNNFTNAHSVFVQRVYEVMQNGEAIEEVSQLLEQELWPAEKMLAIIRGTTIEELRRARKQSTYYKEHSLVGYTRELELISCKFD